MVNIYFYILAYLMTLFITRSHYIILNQMTW